MSKEIKKFSVFQSGRVIAHVNEKGEIRDATEQESVDHLASLLPKTYKKASIESVKYEDGYVLGKYANGKVIRKQLFAQQVTNQSEPVDGPQKVKETEVPRKKEKANPEIDVDNKSVKNPTEIRTKEYKKGPGGEDLHTNIPRDKGDGAGGKKTTYEKETSDKATSGKPDTYVQDFTKSEKPAAAGSEMNHAAGTEIKFRPENEIYTNLKLSKKDEKKDLPPWLKKEDEEEKEDEKDENEETKDEVKEAISKLEGELEIVKAELEKEQTKNAKKEARTKMAIKYAVVLSKINPTKYSDAEMFIEKVEKTAKSMTVQAIEDAIEGAEELKKEADKTKEKSIVKQANKEEKDSGLATTLVIQKTASFNQRDEDELKRVIQSGLTLCQKNADFDEYEKETNK